MLKVESCHAGGDEDDREKSYMAACRQTRKLKDYWC
jgi:hypothetical protein